VLLSGRWRLTRRLDPVAWTSAAFFQSVPNSRHRHLIIANPVADDVGALTERNIDLTRRNTDATASQWMVRQICDGMLEQFAKAGGGSRA